MIEYNQKIVGNQIKAYRQAKGLTQIELAKKTGISKSYIYDIENGGKTKNSSVSMKNICKIATVLGVDLNDLAGSNLEFQQHKNDNDIINDISREITHLSLEELNIFAKTIDIFCER